MKEDKSDNWIASSLKKHLEEGKLPYEIGAWENFQKIRKARKRRTLYYWTGAVAASLALLFTLSQVFLVQNDLSDDRKDVPVLANAGDQAPELGLQESVKEEQKSEVQAPSELPQEQTAKVKEPEAQSGFLAESTSTANEKSNTASNTSGKPEIKAAEETNPPIETVEKQSEAALKAEEKTVAVISPEVEKKQAEKPVNSSSLIASGENPSKTIMLDKNQANKAEDYKAEKLAEVVPTPTVTEEEFPEIPKEQTRVYLGMGVSPGFATMQQNNNTTTASSLGVGMSLNVDLPGKLTLGSGFGLNYLNQQNKSQMAVTVAGYRTSQVDKLDIQQVQLEMPLYFKYPITRNEAISVQAGFSNVYALNQNTEQVTTVNEQVVVSNSSSFDAMNSSSFALQSNAVSRTQELNNPNSKFYPFATVNFGVNIRVHESKSVNYMVMPFYNHQLQTVSGFGDKFGMFGASLKLNFGGSDR